MSSLLYKDDKVLKIIEKYAFKNVPITPESDLLFDLQFDSLRFIQLIVDLEAEFKFEFLDEHLLIEKMDTVERICAIVKDMIERKGDINAE